jgi:hypothetical protein
MMTVKEALRSIARSIDGGKSPSAPAFALAIKRLSNVPSFVPSLLPVTLEDVRAPHIRVEELLKIVREEQ